MSHSTPQIECTVLTCSESPYILSLYSSPTTKVIRCITNKRTHQHMCVCVCINIRYQHNGIGNHKRAATSVADLVKIVLSNYVRIVQTCEYCWFLFCWICVMLFACSAPFSIQHLLSSVLKISIKINGF